MEKDKFLNGKKIAIVYGGFEKNGGGVVTHVKNLEILLKKLNAQVKVFYFGDAPKFISYPIVLVERILNLFIPPLGYRIRFYLTKKYWEWMLPIGFDQYFFEDIYSIPDKISNNYHIFLHALKSDNLQQYKKINNRELRIILELEKKLIERYFSKILVVSPEYGSKIEQQFRLPKLKIFLNFLACNIKKIPWKEKENIILFIGNLEKRKNPLFILQIAKKLEDFKISHKFLIIGQGLMINQIKHEIIKNNIRNVMVLGRLSHNDVLSLMEKSKILLLPSSCESFGFVLLEAKLTGNYVISNTGLTIPETLFDSAIELNPNKWTEKIKKILQSDNIESDINCDNYLIKKAVENLLSIFNNH